jgi:uncharacterized protein YqjF (DUF2071 family)
MMQSFANLLFAHWPVSPEMLRPLVPSRLHIDTFDGHAWVGLVPFRTWGTRLRLLPPLLGAFGELNLRTYVTYAGKPAVWFFSLDVNNALAAVAARTVFRIPFVNADIQHEPEGGGFRFHARRSEGAEFLAYYAPVSPPFRATRGSLDAWLTERYGLFTVGQDGNIYRGDLHHHSWSLQAVEGEIEINTYPAAHGITLPDTPPLLHYAAQQDVLAWPLVRESP